MEKPISKFDNNTHKHKSTYVHKKTKKKPSIYLSMFCF